MFNVLQALDKIVVELERPAAKFQESDELYGCNLFNENIKEGAMCGKNPAQIRNIKTFSTTNSLNINNFKC